MAKETIRSIEYFQQLRNRQNELYRMNTAAIRRAASKQDRDAINKLRKVRAKMAANDQLIFKAELSFQASQLDQSEAEKNLRKHVREINKLVKTIKNITDFLKSAARVTSLITRLIKVLS